MKAHWLKTGLVWMLGAALLAGTVSAQDAAPAQEEKPQAPEESQPGTGNRSLFGDMLSPHWSLTSSLQFMQTFDDNIFLANTFRKSDTISAYSGRFTAAYRGKHTRFEASYLPEYDMNYRYSPLSRMSHAYSQSFTHQFSPQTDISWSLQGSYAPASGGLPFKYIRFFGYTFATYSLEALEPSTNILNGGTSVGMSHRFTPRSKVTVNLHSATTKFKQFRETGLPGALRGQIYSFGANVNWSYDLTARRSVGFTVSHDYTGELDPTGHQQTQGIQATFSQKLPHNFQLAVAAGPSLTERGGTGVDTGVMYSVSLSRQLQRFGFSVNAAKTFQAGLQQQSLSADTVSFNVNRAFGRRWNTGLGGTYSRSQNQGGVSNSENVSGYVQIYYQITHPLSAFTNYRYLHQGSLGAAGAAAGIRNIDRNSVAIGLAYNFGTIRQ